MRENPPRIFLRFFRWYCHPRLVDHIEGDLIEVFRQRLNKKGKRKADIKFIIDVLLLFRPSIIKPVEGYKNLNHYGMIKSYFKIGWRSLLKNKGYSFINISGLTAGLTIAILIGLWIYDELSFNRNHAKYENLAQVYRKETREDRTFAAVFQTTGLAALLKSEYGSYFDHVVLMSTRTQEVVIASGTSKFAQVGYFTQSDGVDMFSLKMLAGDGHELKNPNSILLSESLARKIFGDEDPVNKVVSMDARVDLKVAGIYKDLPGNSEFQDATFFAPIELYTANLNTWDNYNVRIYVQMKEGRSAALASSVIKHASKPHIPGDQKQELFLHPMSQWHLGSEFKDGEQATSGLLMAVWYNGLIGVFVLLLACINFMNLSTARSEHRAKEVGVRRAIGALRTQLMQQFYSESIMVSIISFVAALLLAALCLPSFNAVADKRILMPWMNPFFWFAGLCFVLITSLLAGSYPALYLSSFKTSKALKGRIPAGTFALSSRKILVVFQFTVSVVLAIGTIVVYQQIQHAKNRPVGYSRENLIGLRAASPEFKGKYDVLRNKLKATGMIEEMAEANYSITETLGSNDGFSWQGKVYDQSFNTITVTPEYGKTIGWEFIAGRDFSRDYASDSAGVVINESALQILGIPNPIGEFLHYEYSRKGDGNYKILGVVKDMVKGSPYAPTEPSIIFHSSSDLFWLYVRLHPAASPHDALQKAGSVLEEVVPSAAFDFRFADDAYDAKFKSEVRIGNLAMMFTILAILISSLGLIGLAAFSAEARNKEIGIRKIVGASTFSLWKLMTKDYMILVAIASAIAIPVAYYLMNTWLQQYDYKINISLWTLITTALCAMVLTVLTISYHSIHAALMNPVKSLRSE